MSSRSRGEATGSTATTTGSGWTSRWTRVAALALAGVTGGCERAPMGATTATPGGSTADQAAELLERPTGPAERVARPGLEAVRLPARADGLAPGLGGGGFVGLRVARVKPDGTVEQACVGTPDEARAFLDAPGGRGPR